MGPPGKEGVQAGPLDRVEVGRAGVQAEAKLAGEPAHRQIGDPVLVQERGGGVDHVAFVQLHAATLT